MEQANAVGNTTEVYRIAKKLANKGKTTLSTQPSKDKDGNAITSNEQQLDLWAEFLEKIEAEEDEPEVVLHAENEEELPHLH